MAKKYIPCPTRLRQVADYNPYTGSIKNKINGKPIAATKHVKGYRYGNALGVSFLAHRLAWILHYGTYPSGYIDHINGDKEDNRIDNLRDVTPAQNSANRVATNGSSSKYLGVCFVKSFGKYKAAITKGGKCTHLGLYRNEIDAALAYDEAARIYHGEYARPNFKTSG